MARCGNHLDGQAPSTEAFPVPNQPVELRTVGGEIGQIEDVAKRRLYVADALADDHPGIEPTPQDLRAREMIRVGMAFEHPVKSKSALLDEIRDRIHRFGEREGANGLVVEDRVDDDCVEGRRIPNDESEGGRA